MKRKRLLTVIINQLNLCIMAGLIIVLPFATDTSLMFPTQSAKFFLFCLATIVIFSLFLLQFIFQTSSRTSPTQRHTKRETKALPSESPEGDSEESGKTFRLTTLDTLLVVFLLYSGLNVLLNINDYGISHRFIELLGLAALYLVFRRLNTGAIKVLFIALLISGAAQAIYGNLQLYGIYPSHHSMFNITGGFFNPGPYAGFLAVIFPIALVMYFNSSREGKLTGSSSIITLFKNVNITESQIFRYVSISTVIAILLVLPATRSRAAWLAVVAASVLVFIEKYNIRGVIKRNINTMTTKIAFFVGIVIVAGMATSGLYIMKKGSADGRLLIWKVTTNMIGEKPLFGFGYDRFKANYLNYQAAYFSSEFLPRRLSAEVEQAGLSAEQAGSSSNSEGGGLPISESLSLPTSVSPYSSLSSSESPARDSEAGNAQTEAIVADNSTRAFNEYLQTTTEGGAVGILIILAIAGSFFFGPSKNNGHQATFVAAKMGAFAFGVFALFSYPSEILPIKLCLTFCLAYIASNQKYLHAMPACRTVRSFQGIFQAKAVRVLQLTASLLVLIGTVSLTMPLNNNYRSYKNWKQAFITYQMGAYEVSVKDYRELYPQLKNNGEFLVNYGKACSMAGEHEQAIEVLTRAEQFLPNTIVYTAMGDSYKKLAYPCLTYQVGMDAEQAYIKASNMLPDRFYPKYLLAKLYDETNQQTKAVQTANELLNKDIKVNSIAVEEIKSEMQAIVDKMKMSSK